MQYDATRFRLPPARRLQDALDAAEIRDLSKVRYLDARNCGLEGIEGLSALENLRVLRLDRNRIRDLSPIRGMHTLTGVYLSANDIEDLSATGTLTTLPALDLHRNRIRDIGPLRGCRKLTGCAPCTYGTRAYEP